MTSSGPITRLAHAKLNLCLSVGPPEPAGTIHAAKDVGGYHRIASWMSCISLADEVEVEALAADEASRFQLRWAGDAPRPTPIDWAIEKDLGVRAHAALEAMCGRRLPVRATISKRIPVGAGLGGGSADAGAMLLALRDLFGLDLAESELRSVAHSLGSDVAFFLDDASPARPALVTSFGDGVERVVAVESDIILVVPSFSCATRDVYRAFDEQLAQRVAAKRREIGLRDGPAAAERYQPQPARDDLVRRRIDKAIADDGLDDSQLFNDLFRPALAVEPRLGPVSTALSRATRQEVHLTGSGSCLFLISRASRSEALLAKVRKTLDSLARSDDEQIRTALAGAEFTAHSTRLL